MSCPKAQSQRDLMAVLSGIILEDNASLQKKMNHHRVLQMMLKRLDEQIVREI
jgi:hypothetical protein